MRKPFFIFLFFFILTFVQALKLNFNVICQCFKCKAHVGIYTLELTAIQTRKQISGKCFQFVMNVLFNLPQNRQFGFVF